MKAKVKLISYFNNSIAISGSKNSSLPIIAASILSNEKVIIKNVPNITDIIDLITILKNIGYNISFSNNTVIVYPTEIKTSIFNDKLIHKIRGSYYLIGSLIGKYDYSNFSFLFPGGCKLGKRPINYHIDAFKNMDLNVAIKRNKIYIEGNKKHSIHSLPFPSVGTTINIILASTKTRGITIINNASIEPEVIDTINFLNSIGANISIENRTIKIIGVSYLYTSTFIIPGDRIEAGTYLLLGALHNGITIQNIETKPLLPLINFLTSIGLVIDTNEKCICLKTNANLKPFDITIVPHPGIPTDLGPLICVLASQINGTSTIKETVYINRTSHINELNKLGFNISQNNNQIIIQGKTIICKNKNVKAYDLRCAASLVLAASLSNNYITIKNIDKLFRGYENIQEKLNSLGIDFIIK